MPIESKNCILCGKIFFRDRQNMAWWFTAKYCGQNCAHKRKVSDETKQKMSIARMGNKNSLGYKHTDETKKKISEIRKKMGTPWSKGRKLSPEHREKVLLGLFKNPHRYEKGYKPWNYIIDRTLVKISDRSINDGRYKEWRKIVKNRDGWKCKISNGDCSDRLEAHHILPWVTYPELRYETNNGITLCHAHHPKKREDEIKLAPFLKSLVVA